MIEWMAVKSIAADSVFNPRNAEAHQQADWKREKERRLNHIATLGRVKKSGSACYPTTG